MFWLIVASNFLMLNSMLFKGTIHSRKCYVPSPMFVFLRICGIVHVFINLYMNVICLICSKQSAVTFVCIYVYHLL